MAGRQAGSDEFEVVVEVSRLGGICRTWRMWVVNDVMEKRTDGEDYGCMAGDLCSVMGRARVRPAEKCRA